MAKKQIGQLAKESRRKAQKINDAENHDNFDIMYARQKLLNEKQRLKSLKLREKKKMKNSPLKIQTTSEMNSKFTISQVTMTYRIWNSIMICISLVSTITYPVYATLEGDGIQESKAKYENLLLFCESFFTIEIILNFLK